MIALIIFGVFSCSQFLSCIVVSFNLIHQIHMYIHRETISEHVMTVMVKDQGTPAKKNFARVVVTVHDANDHTPEFSVSLIQGRVFETSPIGITVLTLNAVDKDHGENAEIVYTLSSGRIHYNTIQYKSNYCIRMQVHGTSTRAKCFEWNALCLINLTLN